MTYKAEIRKTFGRREDAYRYLASRGFLFLPSGWENGLWAATLDMANDEFIITIQLRAREAA